MRKYSTLIERKQQEAGSSSPPAAASPSSPSSGSSTSNPEVRARVGSGGQGQQQQQQQREDVPLLAPPTAVRSPAPASPQPERAEPSSQYVRDGEVLAGIAKALGASEGSGGRK